MKDVERHRVIMQRLKKEYEQIKRDPEFSLIEDDWAKDRYQELWNELMENECDEYWDAIAEEKELKYNDPYRCVECGRVPESSCGDLSCRFHYQHHAPGCSHSKR